MTQAQDSYRIGRKERRFNDALKDLFVGAKVDGQSGYINLMRIKAAYYEKRVAPQLFEDVGTALKEFPGFREELFDKLHAFFTRYFSKSGSICFAYTPNHMSVYEKVYSDEQDVVLFWKTHMLYYVKTDRLFRDLKVEEEGQTFFFDCTGLEHKKNNEKRALVFTYDKLEQDGTVRLNVTYSERGRITKTDAILKALKKEKSPVKEAVLLRAIRVFERQSEIDYFINKDARSFLQEQFDLWMYQYLFADGTAWNHGRIRQLQALKEIAFKLIDFIAQFEDELVRIWNKPKFVRGSHFVITLDRIAAQEGGLALLADFVKHQGMADQVAEWRELGIVDTKFDAKAILSGKGKSLVLTGDWKYLPLDTRHFKDLELRLLALFDDLDNQLDGRLVKSENYQALNTFGEKFKGRVKCCYIDPPYNTDEDDFPYLDSFQKSSWFSMIRDRLDLGRHILSDEGVLFSSIGREEFARIRIAFDQVFGERNSLGELVWEKGRKNDAKFFSLGHDYIVVYAKSLAELQRRKTVWREEKPGAREILVEYRRLKKEHGDAVGKIQAGIREFYTALPKSHPALKYRRYNRVDPNGIWRDDNISWPGGNGPRYEVKHPKTKEVCDIPDGGWRFSTPEKFWLYHEHGFIEFRSGKDASKPPMLKRYLNYVPTDFDPDASSRVAPSSEDDEEVSVQVMPSVFYRSQQPSVVSLRNMMGENAFKNPKDPEVIARLLKYTTDPGDLICDFFLGSGSTGEAVLSLMRSNGGRRFLFVEAADYIETVVLPRFKKLAFADQWEDGKAKTANGVSLFFKSMVLEQYEEAVAAAEYYEEDAQADLFRNTKTNPYSQYVFFRDPKMARAIELDYEQNEVHPRLERLYPDIDLAETLSCVTGKWIRRVTADEVVFTDGSQQSLKQPDWRLLKPLIFWGPIV